MVAVPTGSVIETDRTRKTTGNANVPGQLTKQPKDSYAYGTSSSWNHDGNDISGYVGVDEYYRTYADGRNKPLGGLTAPAALGLDGSDESLYHGVEGDGFKLGVEGVKEPKEAEEPKEDVLKVQLVKGEDDDDDSDDDDSDDEGDDEGDDSDDSDDDKKPAKKVAAKKAAPKLPA